MSEPRQFPPPPENGEGAQETTPQSWQAKETTSEEIQVPEGYAAISPPDKGLEAPRAAGSCSLTWKFPTMEVPRAQRSPLHKIAWFGRFLSPQS